MLRITLPTGSDPQVYVLEGRLAGDWATELIRVTRDIDPRSPSIFVIEDVFYVDLLGEKTLTWLNQMGARFITQSAYGKDLYKRLHLHRASTLKYCATKVAKTHTGKAPPGEEPRKRGSSS